MFTIAVIENGKKIRTETRNAGAAHVSAWKTYRDCGWDVERHSFYDVTVSRIL